MVEDATKNPTTLVVLAGGRASRMQSLCATRQYANSIDRKIDRKIDKAQLRIEGKTLLERTLERLQDEQKPFVARAVNSNADPETFRDIVRTFQLEVFPDRQQHKHLGTLAGILAAMRWSQTKKATWLLTVPCDCPFLPKDLWQQLQQRQKKTAADIVCSESQGRRHPVVALWNIALLASLERALGEGVRKIDRWTEQHHTESQTWQQTPDPFFNINRPEDLEQAEAFARATKQA